MPAVLINSPEDNGNIIFTNPDTDPTDIRLLIRGDKNNSDFLQWFNFTLTANKGTYCKLKIENAGKVTFNGWNEHESYKAYASYDGEEWFQVNDTIYNKDTGELTMEVALEQDNIQFAFFPPYDYSRHLKLIEKAAQIPHCKVTTLGETNHGRDITLLTFGTPKKYKQEVWLIARQHPGEPQAEWYAEGLIEYLAKADPLLFDCYTYRIVPNMNPDGTFDGNLRTNGHGKDLNRQWQAANRENSPEVYFVFEEMKKTGVDLFLDIHSDEVIPAPFLDLGHANLPQLNTELEKSEQAFMELYIQINQHMQNELNYGEPNRTAPENLTMAAIAVGDYFRCPAFTLEMPTKNWSIQQCKTLAEDLLKVIPAFEPIPENGIPAEFGGEIYRGYLSYFLMEKPNLLNAAFISTLPGGKEVDLNHVNTMRDYLEKMSFPKHFLTIKSKWQEMEEKAKTDPNYVEAAGVAKTLITKLSDELSDLLMADNSLTLHKKKTLFKDNCIQHLHDAKPILEQHRDRGWKVVIFAILFVLALPVTLPLYACGLFSTKTNSAILIDECEASLESNIDLRG